MNLMYCIWHDKILSTFKRHLKVKNWQLKTNPFTNEHRVAIICTKSPQMKRERRKKGRAGRRRWRWCGLGWGKLALVNGMMNSMGRYPFVFYPSPSSPRGPPQYVTVACWTAPMHQNILIQLSPLPTIPGVGIMDRKPPPICICFMCNTLWMNQSVLWRLFTYTSLPVRTNVARTVSLWDVFDHFVVI